VLVFENPRADNANAIRPRPANFEDWRVQATAFQALAAIADTEINMTSQGEPERVKSQYVSANFFDLLGVGPFWAVAFRKGEDLPNSAPVVVLTNVFGSGDSAANPDIIARTLLGCRSIHNRRVLPPWSYSGL